MNGFIVFSLGLKNITLDRQQPINIELIIQSGINNVDVEVRNIR